MSVGPASIGDIQAAYRHQLRRAGWVDGAPPPEPLTPHAEQDLGRLFEASLQQKQSGAYYTGRDVTEYIVACTVTPRILDLAGNPDSILPGPDEDITPYLRPSIRSNAPLPLESEWEFRRRRRRVTELIERHRSGGIGVLEDWLTHNLNLELRLIEWIGRLADPERLWRFYDKGLGCIRILDPTCGAGAFLLSAGDLLARLYDACLGRMETLSRARGPNGREFLRELRNFEDPRGRGILVRRRILARSLFGVDLMEGAVDVCRMRLTLWALSATPPVHRRPLSAVPHIGMNLRCGDAVAGDTLADPMFSPTPGHPGFDVVVGNPPYIEAALVRNQCAPRGFVTERCPNVCAWVVERALQFLQPEGRLGMVLPISAVSGAKYEPLMRLLRRRGLWISSFSNRPAKLFDGVEQRLAIVAAGPEAESPPLRTSDYQHWYRAERPFLFERLFYRDAPECDMSGMPARAGSAEAASIYGRIRAARGRLADLYPGSGAAIWLHDGPTYWVRALSFQPNAGMGRSRSRHYHRVDVKGPGEARVLAAILSSTLYYFFFKATSNCRDLGRSDWEEFPIDPLSTEREGRLAQLGAALEARLRETARERIRVYPSGPVRYEEYYPARAKEILDAVDTELAEHYGLRGEELEYLLHLDLKYRMGE